jgi:hypothetical protein
MDLISLADWSDIPLFKNTGVGATGYSPRAMCKALFIMVVKNLSSVNELIFFLQFLFLFPFLFIFSLVFIFVSPRLLFLFPPPFYCPNFQGTIQLDKLKNQKFF